MDQRLTPREPKKPPKQPIQRYQRWLLVGSAAGALGLWELIVYLGELPAFILPTPRRVAARGWLALTDGTLLYHAGITLLEVVLGLIAGSLVATMLGYALSRSRVVEQLVSPYLVASQAIPVVAIAPLLVIWFGPGMFSKVLVCAMIVFFPILVNTMVGLQAVSEDLHDLMRAMRATRWQTLRYLELPAALPVILGGLRVGATLSVTGAVVGEFIGADRGLGFLINVGRGQYDTALVFVTIFALVVMALSLYGLVILAERRLLRWRQNGHQ